MSEDLHAHPSSASVAAMPALFEPPAASTSHGPLVWVAADDAPAARRWCEALEAEGLRAHTRALGGNEADGDEADGGDGAQALVLHCSQRLPERLGRLRELRAWDGQRPLMVVAAELRDIDQVLALEMGADDVIDARVSAPVVAARLRALWRRGAGPAASTPDHLAFGRLSLHLRERRVQLGAERVEMTECEFEVLWLLALNAGRAVSRAEMLERLRGLPYQRIDRSIDCRVYRIRAKLRDGEGATQHIRTVRNCGYLFSPARW
jgi:two-component system, OmpR family, response regulator RstA